MSLRDEMATDYAEMVGDDSTTATYLGLPSAPVENAIAGRKSASMPTSEQMLDAGYNPRANCDFLVTQAALTAAGITPVERARFQIGSVVWTIKGIDDKKEGLGFTYSLTKQV